MTVLVLSLALVVVCAMHVVKECLWAGERQRLLRAAARVNPEYAAEIKPPKKARKKADGELVEQWGM